MDMQDLGLHGLIGGVSGLPSVLDWSAYTTNYNWSATPMGVNPNSYGTFLNITGEGFLIFARGDTNAVQAKNPNMRITVDGVAYVFEGVNAGGAYQGNILVNPIYYKTSLKIELFNRDVSARALFCDYTYLAKTSTPSKFQTLLSSPSRKMAYGINSLSSNVDVVNITGSGYLLAIEFTGRYGSGSSGHNVGTLTVDSVIKMNARNTFNPATEDTKHHSFNGPIRFNENLKVQHRDSSGGFITAITRVWYVLD